MTSVASATTDMLPSIIATAGEQAVEQYRAYFNQVIRNHNTRRAYRSMANRFLKWAVGHGLSLTSISADDATDFVRVARRTLGALLDFSAAKSPPGIERAIHSSRDAQV